MSVNAINPADQQQKGSKTSAAIGGGLALGAIGATTGYFMGNKRPSLEELLKNSDKDTFTKQEVTSIDAEAAGKLDEAKKAYQSAGATEKATLKDASKKYGAALTSTAPENANLVTEYNTAKTNLTNKKVKIGDVEKSFAEVKQALADAQAKVKGLPADATEDVKTAANQELETAKENMKKFKEGASEEISALKSKAKALMDGRKAKFEAAAAKDGAEKTLTDALNDAKSKFTEAKSKKMTELLTDDLKAAFDKVKKAFPKEGGWKKAGIYGGIAAAAGILLGAIFGGGKKEEA